MKQILIGAAIAAAGMLMGAFAADTIAQMREVPSQMSDVLPIVALSVLGTICALAGCAWAFLAWDARNDPDLAFPYSDSEFESNAIRRR